MGNGCGRERKMMGELGEFLEEFTNSIIMQNSSATATVGETIKTYFATPTRAREGN